MSQKLKAMVDAILADGKVDAAEVESLRTVLYEDGAIDINELSVLFQINNAVSGNANSPEWAELFVQAGTDAVLGDSASAGAVDTEEADLLISFIGEDGKVDKLELLLLVNICDQASSCDEKLIDFTLKAIQAAILEDGVVDSEEVDMLRKVILGQGGDGGASVSEKELDALFAINDATTGKPNCPEWDEFFVEAATAAYLEDGVLDAEESADLIKRIGADGQVSELEKDLVANILDEADSVDPSFEEFAAKLK